MHAATSLHCTAIRILLRGRVQGIGIRPTIARLAGQWNLKGFVRNCPKGVEVVAKGDAAAIDAFLVQIAASLPNHAATVYYDAVQDSNQPCSDDTKFGQPPDTFVIAASDGAGALSTPVPPDINVCADCLGDARAPNNRRHQYPFTSCTACGPRFSIIRAMPYDRAYTSMDEFLPCTECTREYSSPADRRYHAQTNACPACGPAVWCCDTSGRILAREQKAVDLACKAIQAGKIVALKGIGGYLLLVDATAEPAVIRLRARKQRPAKPLAVLVADVPAAQSLARLSAEERCQLTSPAGPIVLAEARPGNGLVPSLHPGMREIGLMFPCTVLHEEIACHCGPVVATSGNLEGDPLKYETAVAQSPLSSIADLFLHHDRPIERPIDDSVVRVIAGRPVTLRLARGFAPLALDLPDALRTDRHIVALGGEQKSAIAIYNGHQAALGPHLGDLGGVMSRQRFREQLAGLQELYQVDQPIYVVDQHPSYFTTSLAQDLQNETIAVQHHHAHLAATMLEHGWLDREVLGVVWDGTGYGSDATVWGGEFLAGTASRFRRIAHLRPFRLLGGDKAIREPRRVAASMLVDTFGVDEAVQIIRQLRWGADEVQFLPLFLRPQLGLMTTSAGRLFDAVAAIVLDIDRAAFEGHPAMLLESVCDLSTDGYYSLPITVHEPVQLDWRPLVRSICEDMRCGVAAGAIAMRFHRTLACAVAAICKCHADLPVALCGGVFQNRILAELVTDELSKRKLGLPGFIPPNDGGLAAGQLVVALSCPGSGRHRPGK